MLKLYRRFCLWLFPEPEQPRDPREDRSSLANLVRLLQDNDPPNGLPN
jgi:hypothetical protein